MVQNTCTIACPLPPLPQLGVSEWREDRQYDVVTCMFAIHYFFVTEQALKQVGRGPSPACAAKHPGHAEQVAVGCMCCVSQNRTWLHARHVSYCRRTAAPCPVPCSLEPPGPSAAPALVCPSAVPAFFLCAHAQFLHNVSINLKEGGYFIGTVPDGKRINECIKT